ncbi:MAG TPA: hypothetical protein VFQ30_12850 [Ktedonobacteraceae bacterium]|nr:hypothetical protein [Ktedonobacteraceae bacterium]
MHTAMQKIRLALTGSPFGEPHFQHEGEKVTRWMTGGTLPDLYVTFQQREGVIEVRCATCQALLGNFPSRYGGNTVQQIAAMRQSGHHH